MERVEIGRLGKPYNLEGGLKFKGEPLIFDLEKIYIEGLGYRVLEDAEELNNEVVLYLKGIESRQEAERIAGLKVLADKEDLPKLEAGEYYYFELVGKPVFVDDKPFGEVAEVEGGVQDLLIIKANGTSLRAQSKTYMVPLQAPYVKIEADGIHVEAIAGLFD